MQTKTLKKLGRFKKRVGQRWNPQKSLASPPGFSHVDRPAYLIPNLCQITTPNGEHPWTNPQTEVQRKKTSPKGSILRICRISILPRIGANQPMRRLVMTATRGGPGAASAVKGPIAVRLEVALEVAREASLNPAVETAERDVPKAPGSTDDPIEGRVARSRLTRFFSGNLLSRSSFFLRSRFWRH